MRNDFEYRVMPEFTYKDDILYTVECRKNNILSKGEFKEVSIKNTYTTYSNENKFNTKSYDEALEFIKWCKQKDAELKYHKSIIL